MRRLLIVPGLAICLVLALASTAPAVTLELKDGSIREAEVVKVNDRDADPHFIIRIAGREQQLLFSAIKPESVYRGWSSFLGNEDPAGHIALGVFCDEHDLTEEAVREFTLAREISERMQRRAADLLGTARIAAARAIFAQARQQEMLGAADEALRLYARVWANYPDATDLRDETRSAIISLCEQLNRKDDAERILKNVVQPPQPVQPNPNPNPGAQPNPVNPAPNPAADLDDQTGWSRKQVRQYDDLSKNLERVRARMEDGLTALQQGQNSEASGQTNDSAKQFENADLILVDALEKGRPLEAEKAEWMPKLSRQVSSTIARIENALLQMAKSRMHYFARRAKEHERMLEQAAKWTARVLALAPEDEEGIRVRMLLTELAITK